MHISSWCEENQNTQEWLACMRGLKY